MVFPQTRLAIEALKEQVSGSLLAPDDPGYDDARRAWDLNLKQRPALILIPEVVQDVIAGVRFAREQGLGIAVQSTGHGVLYPADDNLLIIASRLKAVQVDAETHTARAEAGAVWKDIMDQSTPHGLAPLLGTAPHVGIVGYTLGRGIGWLGRRYGFAADSVRSIDLVTADGELRHASASENSDLFWGLRGGGGIFGVVTAIEFDLFPVPTVYGGNLIYPGELAREALRFFREWIKTVPDELTSSIAVLKFPSFPPIPQEMWGKVQVVLRAAYAGEAADGEAVMQKWLDWHTPITNTFHEMPFSEIGTIQNDPVQPTAGFGSHEMLDELSDAVIDVIIQYATDAASPLAFSELRHAGGAMAHVAPDASAISHQDALLYLQIGGLTPAPEAYAAAKAYIPRYQAALRPYVKGGVYLNFVKGGDARERIKDAYAPETYERLLALKAKYDPDNRFHYSYQLVAD